MDAQRRGAWKRLAEDSNSLLTPPAQRKETQAPSRRGPERVNEYGDLETMDLSHKRIPRANDGAEAVPRWPSDHAAIDPHRKLKKRQ
jgi:hypothetical protein